MSIGFSGELWDGITGIYDAILAHPFITGLTDGTLPGDAFAFYVTQDALYLRQYARALALVGSRAADPAATEMFARHAAEAISVEQQLHSSLLASLGISPDVAAAAEPAPCNLAYTSYLLSVASTGSYAEGVGAVLPCYWIYWEVGKELVRRGSPDARYQRWIDTYGGAEFGETVREVIAVTDLLGTGLAPGERAQVHHAFRLTSRYEWMFWDMGYRRESWPVLNPLRSPRGVVLPSCQSLGSALARAGTRLAQRRRRTPSLCRPLRPAIFRCCASPVPAPSSSPLPWAGSALP